MAKAIMCDKCGKINLLADEKPYMYPCGIYRLVNDGGDSLIDLCEVCAAELMEAARRTKEDTE